MMRMPELEEIDIFILCGGAGKRLKSLSGEIPKPMIGFHGRPFLDVMIGYLSSLGFRRFILGAGYGGDYIKDYYRKKRHEGVSIKISRERRPLDTGGAVKLARKFIESDPFFVMNGDCLCEFDPRGFLSFHMRNGSAVSLLLKKTIGRSDYGNIDISKDGRITKFVEKAERAGKKMVSAGIYIFNKETFRLMPGREKFSLERDFFPAMGYLGKEKRAAYSLDFITSGPMSSHSLSAVDGAVWVCVALMNTLFGARSGIDFSSFSRTPISGRHGRRSRILHRSLQKRRQSHSWMPLKKHLQRTLSCLRS